MSNNNGQEETRRKKCPFLGEWCIKDACAIYVEMTQHMGGMQRKMGMCSFSATNMILSELNNKTQLPQQKIMSPSPLLRG